MFLHKLTWSQNPNTHNLNIRYIGSPDEREIDNLLAWLSWLEMHWGNFQIYVNIPKIPGLSARSVQTQ